MDATTEYENKGSIIVMAMSGMLVIPLFAGLLLHILAMNSITFNIGSQSANGLLEQPQTTTAKRLYDKADIVAIGTIINSSTTMEDSEIWRYMAVRVDEFLKNPQTGNLTIKTMGGIVGDIGSVVEDSPLFNDGDRVLLFLYKDSQIDAAYRVSPYSGLLDDAGTSKLLSQLRSDIDHTKR